MKPSPTLPPSLDLERALWSAGLCRVAGVDEAGRGPLAGPVVAAACVLPVGCTPIPGVRDSKLVPLTQRDALAAKIIGQAVAYGLGAASVAEIASLNIHHAAHLAMRRALSRVRPYDHALIDGRGSRRIDLGSHTAIVDGDALVYSIACASILAKVTRDHLMRLLAARYPLYGWEHNFGYPTPEHLAALQAHGPTPYHRMTFAPLRPWVLPGLFGDEPAEGKDSGYDVGVAEA